MLVGPQLPQKARCPQAGKDSLWALGPQPGRTSSAGRKTQGPRRRPRSREAGGGPPWPGRAAGGGSPGYAARCQADTPWSKLPSVTLPAPPCVPFPGAARLLPAPYRGQERERRVSGDRLGAESADSASRSGAASSQAGRDDTQGKGGRGRGESGAQTIQGAARRGGGERPGGRTGQETPPGRGPGPAPGSRLCKGPPAASLLTTAPAGHRPPFPQHRPLMSFPDLPPTPTSLPTRGCRRSDSPSLLQAERAAEYPRGPEAAQSRFPVLPTID